MNTSPDISAGVRVEGSPSLCGLFARRQVWLPTWRGWLVLVLLAIFSCGVFIRGIHSFLAVNAPVDAEVLVVEAWVPNYALKVGMDRAAGRDCRFLLLAGGTVKGEVKTEAGDTYARMAEVRLKHLGGSTKRVRLVESGGPTRDRTYSSAVAVRDWLTANGVETSKMDVLTVGPHARRSRLLYQQAMGPVVKVGIISVPNREYDAGHWWRYSEGVKEVLSEGAAYFYSRFLFVPD